MTHHSPDHGHGSHSVLHFPETEWQSLQADDLKAGKAVIGLMVGIFTIGLLLYLGVFLVVLAIPVI